MILPWSEIAVLWSKYVFILTNSFTMKRFYLQLSLILAAYFTPSAIFSQNKAPEIFWQKCLGGVADDKANVIIATKDGGFAVAGYTNSTEGDLSEVRSNSDNDGWIVKFSAAGSIEWQKSLGAIVFDDAFTSLIQTKDGGYMAAGIHGSTDEEGFKGAIDAWVVKLDPLGEIQWEHYYGGTGVDILTSIIETNDGGYAFSGYTYSNDKDITGNHGGGQYINDVWIVKLNSAGAIEWQRCYGGTDDDYANKIIQTKDGGYAVAAYTASNNGDVTGFHGGYDSWVLKLSSNGSLLWQRCLGGSLQEIANSIVESEDGLVVAGFAQSANGDVVGNHASSTPDAWVFKLNASDGRLEWQNCIGGSKADAVNSIIKTKDGGFAITGFTNSSDGDVNGVHFNTNDMWVVKLSFSGSIQWQKSIGGSAVDEGFSIVQEENGNFLVAGTTTSSDGDASGFHGEIYPDAWIVRLSNSAIVSNQSEQIDQLTVTAFPNPTTSSFMLSFELPQAATVKTTITNTIGQVVMEMREVVQNVGMQKRLVDLRLLPKGTYFITVQCCGKYATKVIENI